MGVDVNLYAIGAVTDEELAEAERFVAERMEGSPDWGEAWLERSEGEPSRIDFATLSRYYGPGYERGFWPRIHNYIMAFRAALDGKAVVHYGPDSDWPEAPEADDERMADLWAHWLGGHGLAYYSS